MTVTKINITDLQFSPTDSDVVQSSKLRRLVEEFRRLQQTVNALTANVATSATPILALGEWSIQVAPGSPPTFVITYNDGGTIRTGSITLS